MSSSWSSIFGIFSSNEPDDSASSLPPPPPTDRLQKQVEQLTERHESIESQQEEYRKKYDESQAELFELKESFTKYKQQKAPVRHEELDEIQAFNHQVAQRIKNYSHGTLLFRFYTKLKGVLVHRIDAQTKIATGDFTPHSHSDLYLEATAEGMHGLHHITHDTGHLLPELINGTDKLANVFTLVSHLCPYLGVAAGAFHLYNHHNLIENSEHKYAFFYEKSMDETSVLIESFALQYTYAMRKYLTGEQEAKHPFMSLVDPRYAKASHGEKSKKKDVLQLMVAEAIVNLEAIELSPTMPEEEFKSAITTWVRRCLTPFSHTSENSSLLLNSLPSHSSRTRRFIKGNIETALKVKRLIDNDLKVPKEQRFDIVSIEHWISHLQEKLRETVLVNFKNHIEKRWFWTWAGYMGQLPAEKLKAFRKYLYTVSHVIDLTHRELTDAFIEGDVTAHDQVTIIDLFLLNYTAQMVSHLRDVPGLNVERMTQLSNEFNKHKPKMAITVPPGNDPDSIVTITLYFNARQAIRDVAHAFVLKQIGEGRTELPRSKPLEVLEQLKDSFIRNNLAANAAFCNQENSDESSLTMDSSYEDEADDSTIDYARGMGRW